MGAGWDASAPSLFGAPPGDGPLLPWSWPEARLLGAHVYWLATVTPRGRPRTRPVWGVWLGDALLVSSGGLPGRDLRTCPELSAHLEDGDAAVIVEGVGELVTDDDERQRFCDAYDPKYGWSFRPTDVPGRVRDDDGTEGPVFALRPRVVLAWEPGFKRATRFSPR
jgi:hypothetical protein